MVLYGLLSLNMQIKTLNLCAVDQECKLIVQGGL